MRTWLFHPLVLYPFMAVAAAALIFFSLRPDFAMGGPSAQSGRMAGEALVLEGAALASPDIQPDQVAFVPRDGLGRPTALRLAVLPNQPAPGPADTGARILLNSEAAAALGEGPVTVEVTVRPVPITTAAGLAVSLQGPGPAEWQTREVSPQAQVLRFDFPTHPPRIDAVGLRVISANGDYNYGFEIARIRIVPASAAPGQ